jgi:tryptophan synthase alpha chain
VRTAEQARAIAERADGVVVGSALVDALQQNLDTNGKAGPHTIIAVTDLVSSLANGIRSAHRVAAV